MAITKQEAARQAAGRDAQQYSEFCARADTEILKSFGTDDPVLVPVADTPTHIVRLANAEYEDNAHGWRCISCTGADEQLYIRFE